MATDKGSSVTLSPKKGEGESDRERETERATCTVASEGGDENTLNW